MTLHDSPSESRYFDPTPEQRETASALYSAVADLPLICPHTHVDPYLFSDPDYRFGSPTELLIIPDHYIFRMLYSQGIPLEQLGISRRDGEPVERDHRRIWQTFAEHFHLFRGTPTGMWLKEELRTVFGVRKKLTGETAQEIYDHLVEDLAQADFAPRKLFERFNVEVLCTTDPATSTLEHHLRIRESDWDGRILPTFRPDNVVNLDTPGIQVHLRKLSEVSGIEVTGYRTYLAALEQRRAFFKEMGASATDHAALTPFTGRLSGLEANTIIEHALNGQITGDEARCFTGHMLIELARMSVEDGLTMQLHVGSYRNHNLTIFEKFGIDMGADIPIATEFTRNLQPLLSSYGTDKSFTLILYTLDESTYSRELAPLAGHYPAVKLGAPWWFHDSWNGMKRFKEHVMETAGLYYTVGFNDDTRAFPSIPVRHHLARRSDANWLANLVARDVIDLEDAYEMIRDAAYNLPKRAYKL